VLDLGPGSRLRTLAFCLLISGVALVGCERAEDKHAFPRPSSGALALAAEGSQIRSVVFAGGCFWCTEAVFEELSGVEEVVSGYAGGTAETADYKTVSSGGSDHAEVIQITYDPARISYGALLEVFFAVAHDPTQLNYQGPDHGRQYRSAIFFGNEEEKQTAQAYIDQLDQAGAFGEPIVTVFEPLEAFYPAEQYHQDFVRRNPKHDYVKRFARPKVSKVRKQYAELVARSGHR
jgi:peptide-methionine (S)-S-oxide reductase